MPSTNPYDFEITSFRERFPELKAVTDAQISLQQTLGPEYLSVTKYWGTSAYTTQQAIAMLVVAHLSQISSNGAGAPAGAMTGATEGSTSVSFSSNQASGFSASFWGLTGYGQQLWAMLRPKLTPRMVSGNGRVLV